jgi:hypothetical protein
MHKAGSQRWLLSPIKRIIPTRFARSASTLFSNALSRTPVVAALARAYLMDLPEAGTIK